MIGPDLMLLQAEPAENSILLCVTSQSHLVNIIGVKVIFGQCFDRICTVHASTQPHPLLQNVIYP